MRRRAMLVAGLLLAALPGARGWLAAETIYVAFGDSITEGVGDNGPNGGPNSGYPIRLQQLLGDATVHNRGYSGERTTEGLTRIDTVLPEGGDVLLLMEGSNDLTQNVPLETVLFNLSEMARKATDAGMSVVHATVIPRIPTAKADHENILNAQLNQGIRNLAGLAGRTLVDNFQVFSSLSQLFNKYYYGGLPKDPVGHPNADGYDVMSEAFYDALEGLDTVPPVPGLLTPNYGDARVPGATPLHVDVWDFGLGIDLLHTTLLIDGVATGVLPTGSIRYATLQYTPPEDWSGLVRVTLQTRDLADPPNRFSREIILFTGENTDFLAGDFDFSGSVDEVDLSRLISAFATRSGDDKWDPCADINGDGVVDGFDLAILAHDYGQTI